MASADRGRGNGGDHVRAPARGLAPALDQSFDRDGLYALRAAVAAHAADLGAPDEQVEDLVVIANELASNAIRHGGGAGRLRLWREDHGICCQVTDAGSGMAEPDTAGTRRAPLAAPGGRGLWIVRQLAADLEVRTGQSGTVVTATVPVGRTAH